jgi:hypothetical protein
MRTVSNHRQLLISKASYSYPANGTVFTDALASGVVAVVDAENKVTNSAVTGDYFWIAQSQGAGLPIIKSAPILKSTAKSFIKNYAVNTSQVDYIGFNGTSGSIEFVADQPIIVRTSLKTNFYQFQDKEVHLIADANPDALSTEETVAKELCKSLIQNSEKQVNIPFSVGRVNSDAGSATTEAVTLVKGSKTAVTATAADFSVGDYLRTGTATTSVVYKVVAISGGDLTLDIAYQGANVTLAIAAAEFITAANAVAGTFGIKLEGKDRKFQEGVFRYEANKWLTSIQGAANTEISTTPAFEGTGTWKQVAEDEWFLQLQEGMHQSHLIQIPPVYMRKNVVIGQSYDLVEIEWSDVAGGTDILHNPVNFKALKIAYAGSGAIGASTLLSAINNNI